MDQDVLVGPNIAAAQKLTQLLDSEGVKPRAVVWVHEGDRASWRLWVVPSKELTDKREFYRRVVDVISKHKDQLPGLETSDTEFVPEAHPAILGLRKVIRVEGTSSVHFSNNIFNGFYLPDAVIIRMAF